MFNILSILNNIFIDIWVLFSFDVFLLQLVYIYILVLFIWSKNLFYNLIYLFLIIIYSGLYLCIIQYELFTGFLWVLEFTIVFISIILLFFLNINLNNLKMNYKKYNVLTIYLLGIVFFTVFKLFTSYNYIYSTNYYYIYIIDILLDFYQSLYNQNNNDFTLLYYSYYLYNNIEFLVIGFFLFFGSIGCVLLNKEIKNINNNEYLNILNKYNFYTSFFDFNFLRKQDLIIQSNYKPSIKLYKKRLK